MLLLLTGLRIGGVGFTAELHDSRPALDETWEDIVEVPFRPVEEETWLLQWNGSMAWELELEERDYRVRYSATGMDAGDEPFMLGIRHFLGLSAHRGVRLLITPPHHKTSQWWAARGPRSGTEILTGALKATVRDPSGQSPSASL
jgi:hypothetical protein